LQSDWDQLGERSQEEYHSQPIPSLHEEEAAILVSDSEEEDEGMAWSFQYSQNIPLF